MKKWIVLLSCVAMAACSGQKSKSPDAEKKSVTKVENVVEKYPNGVVKLQGHERGDKRIGKWESFYPNGYKWSEITYVNGYKEGPVVTYYKNGIMRYEGNYYNDERSGIWMFYDTTGVTLKKINMDLPHADIDSLLHAQ